MTSLKVEELTAGYGDLIVVRDLSFEAQPGQVLALLGRNGAGKTTTLRTICGLNKPSAGRVLLGDQDLSDVPAFDRVGMGLSLVQEGKQIFRERTVEENLVLGAYSARLGRSELTSRMEAVVDRFPVLRGRLGKQAGWLSGGQQQMLSIAQALMRDPGILLLDEPSAGLAPAIVGEVYDIIAYLRDAGMTIILVEQAAGWAESVANRLVVMDTGRKLFDGAPGTSEAAQAIAAIQLRDAASETSGDLHETEEKST